MSYRSITVNGTQHWYTVGRIHVKVRGLGAFIKSEVGRVVHIEQRCECCGEPYDTPPRRSIEIAPSDIERLIKRESTLIS